MFANHFLFSDFFLLFVDTISPSSKKKSDIFIACESNPPGLFLMSNIIPKNIRNQRSRMLRSLSEKKSRAFYNSQLNSKRIVLYESENKYGYIHGYTDNYVKVRAPWDPKLSNKLVYSKLQNIDDEGFMRTEKIIQNKNVRQVSYSDAHG